MLTIVHIQTLLLLLLLVPTSYGSPSSRAYSRPPTMAELALITNDLIFQNHVLEISHPIPEWMNGVYVSILLISTHTVAYFCCNSIVN